MDIASLVLGIVSLILGFIPFCGSIAFIPAVVGLILGIVSLVQKSKTQSPKGMAIAGIILNALAILIILFWLLVMVASSVSA